MIPVANESLAAMNTYDKSKRQTVKPKPTDKETFSGDGLLFKY